MEVGKKHAHALIVFCDSRRTPLTSWLHVGFAHCFVCVFVNNHWVICDALFDKTTLAVVERVQSSDLVKWYRERGHTVAEATLAEMSPKWGLLGPYTCVESAKRILGIRAPWTLTPWQLYRRLIRIRRKEIRLAAS
jgi:hypothetical protein